MIEPSNNRPVTMNLSLFFILGVIIFILPSILNIFGLHLPSYTFRISMILIVMGIIDMVFLQWAIV